MCSVLMFRWRKEAALLSQFAHTSHAYVNEICVVWQE